MISSSDLTSFQASFMKEKPTAETSNKKCSFLV